MTDEPSPELVDRLISAAQRLADAPPAPEPSKRRPPMLAAVGAAVAVALGVATWMFVGGQDDDSSAKPSGDPTAASVPSDATLPTASSDQPAVTESAVTEPASTAPTTAVASTAQATTTPATTAPATTAPATTVSASTVPVVAPAVETTVLTTDGATPPVRWAEFSAGKVYLRGKVPDQATADKVREKAAAVVGESNVVVEYQIVPGTPVPKDAPLYVRDSILFAPGSKRLTSDAAAVLDLGVLLFQQNPQMSMIVEGHTDSGGTFEDNLLLSEGRVDEILQYFADRGVDPSRYTGVAKGESEPIANNDTADGRALNRRVEVEIINLLG